MYVYIYIDSAVYFAQLGSDMFASVPAFFRISVAIADLCAGFDHIAAEVDQVLIQRIAGLDESPRSSELGEHHQRICGRRLCQIV